MIRNQALQAEFARRAAVPQDARLAAGVAHGPASAHERRAGRPGGWQGVV